MGYTFHDKNFKHKTAKWWQVFNLVSCYDSRGGVTPVTVYKVYSFRLWNIELTRLPFEV